MHALESMQTFHRLIGVYTNSKQTGRCSYILVKHRYMSVKMHIEIRQDLMTPRKFKNQFYYFKFIINHKI